MSLGGEAETADYQSHQGTDVVFPYSVQGGESGVSVDANQLIRNRGIDPCLRAKTRGPSNSLHDRRARDTSDLQNAVAEAVRRSQDYFTAIQSPEGYWWGEFESNATMEAEYLLFTHFLGIGDSDTWRKLANHILQVQREDGTWGQYYEAPGDLSTTVECYFALKLAGISVSDSRMVKAREFILEKGGVPQTTGLHQDMAGILRPVELEGRAHSSTGNIAAAIVVPNEPVRLLELGTRHDIAAQHRVVVSTCMPYTRRRSHS